jgi:hypothetical protein
MLHVQFSSGPGVSENFDAQTSVARETAGAVEHRLAADLELRL